MLYLSMHLLQYLARGADSLRVELRQRPRDLRFLRALQISITKAIDAVTATAAPISWVVGPT